MFFEETNVFSSGGHSNYRIPSLVVTNDGTVLAFCTDRIGTLKDYAEEIDLVCAIKKPGQPWSPVRILAHQDGWACNIGSAVYDPACNRVIVFYVRNPVARNEFGNYTAEQLAEMDRRAKEATLLAAKNGITAGMRRLVSEDNGAHFIEEAHAVQTVLQRHWDGTEHPVDGSTHGSAHGICLRHGKYAGRLLCPSRTKIGEYSDWDKLRECVYNNAIYSDDHGKTWKASQCVQVGTAEGTLIERADGSILYNSRGYFKDGKRYLALSHDGGETYGNFSTDDFLLEEKRIGCNASLLRVELADLPNPTILPPNAEDLVVFCNPRADTRTRMTACVSFDSGAHFCEARVIFDGPCAYSGLDYDKNSGHFFLLYERGTKDADSSPYAKGLYVAEFDTEWLLQAIK
ncbi:MAG: exo-alpha-sialidase [Clostridia bacterium]|nr:exo-alpha-sialidase [Clostridia bacterium]